MIDDVRSEISEIGLNLTKIKEFICYVSSRPKTCCDQNKIHYGQNKVYQIEYKINTREDNMIPVLRN